MAVRTLGSGLAKVKLDTVYAAPCRTSILYPAAGGNMHCFTAMTPCAMLDVLGPPYSDPDGRHCTYYNDFPYGIRLLQFVLNDFFHAMYFQSISF